MFREKSGIAYVRMAHDAKSSHKGVVEPTVLCCYSSHKSPNKAMPTMMLWRRDGDTLIVASYKVQL